MATLLGYPYKIKVAYYTYISILKLCQKNLLLHLDNYYRLILSMTYQTRKYF